MAKVSFLPFAVLRKRYAEPLYFFVKELTKGWLSLMGKR